MKYIAIIFKAVFAFYALIIFAISLCIVIPVDFIFFSLFPKKNSPKLAHEMTRLCARWLILFYFVNLKIENKEKIDPQKTYVFIANHLSLLDIPVYAVSCKNTFRFLAKDELTKIPLLGYLIKNLYITVRRSDKNDRTKSMEKMLTSLKNGISVYLCPEGTRNKSGKSLLDFKDGAFRVAIASQKPLAIFTLVNTNKLLSANHSLQMRPGPVYGKWVDVIETKGMTEDDLPRLKEMARTAMESQLTKFINI